MGDLIMKRSAGVLLPIASLPSDYGIGTMGEQARKFIKFLKKAKQTYWQILPIGPTGYGDSPYQSFSTFAGNPYFIDLDDLKKEGLLKTNEYTSINWGKRKNRIDYEAIYQNRFKVLRKACNRISQKKLNEFNQFVMDEAYWLEDYALYMATKESLGGIALQEWPKNIRTRDDSTIQALRIDLKEEVLFWKKIQFLFYDQWRKLKNYAQDHGIYIIGDLPIYVSGDSADVWCHPKLFQLNKEYVPIEVAGCPPDGFSVDGQLWGNPLFDWEYLKKNKYEWWILRVKHQLRFYDILRIDHFRGFSSYYAIPFGNPTASDGRWCKGPGYDLFKAIKEKLGDVSIMAEDLGFLSEDVHELLNQTGYPGMKVLQFAFDSRETNSVYLPHTYNYNCVVYAGTHDNDTIQGWLKTANKQDVKRAKEYFHLTKEEGYHWGVIRAQYASVANLAITQFQDLLGLDSKARINIPSTLGNNWVYRCNKEDFRSDLAIRLGRLAEVYGRYIHGDERK